MYRPKVKPGSTGGFKERFTLFFGLPTHLYEACDIRSNKKHTVVAAICFTQALFGMLLLGQQSDGWALVAIIVLIIGPFAIVFTCLLEARVSKRQQEFRDEENRNASPNDSSFTPGHAERVSVLQSLSLEGVVKSVPIANEASEEVSRTASNEYDPSPRPAEDEAGDLANEKPREETCGPGPLMINADATLLEGLRSVLAHHLRRSVGTDVVCLSTSQAELMEHHLARLASYAQKIVHTLAFATRFFAQSQRYALDGDGDAMNDHVMGFDDCTQLPRLGAVNGGVTTAPATVEAAACHKPKKLLKLNDEEILKLYSTAQVEAEKEADWRGIEGPVMSQRSVDTRQSQPFESNIGLTNRAPVIEDYGHVNSNNAETHEYLQWLGRALQEGADIKASGVAAAALAPVVAGPGKIPVCCRSEGLPLPKHAIGAPIRSFENPRKGLDACQAWRQ